MAGRQRWTRCKRTARILTAAGVLAAVVPVVSATEANAFCLVGMSRWQSGSTIKTMAMSTSFSSAMRSATQAGLLQWSNRANSVLKYTYVYTSTYYNYAWQAQFAYPSTLPNYPGYAKKNGTAGHYDQNGGTLYLNPAYTWINGSHNTSQGTADTQTVVVHEVGHFTGLAHPYPSSCNDGGSYTAAEMAAVMTAVGTGTRRTLNSDDLDGLDTLY